MGYLEHLEATPSQASLDEVAQLLTDVTEVQISPEQAGRILKLYPFARIKIALDDGLRGVGTRDELAFVAAHFFLGCSWPTLGDNIDLEKFLDLLREQAGLMGYPPIARAPNSQF